MWGVLKLTFEARIKPRPCTRHNMFSTGVRHARSTINMTNKDKAEFAAKATARHALSEATASVGGGERGHLDEQALWQLRWANGGAVSHVHSSKLTLLSSKGCHCQYAVGPGQFAAAAAQLTPPIRCPWCGACRAPAWRRLRCRLHAPEARDVQEVGRGWRGGHPH